MAITLQWYLNERDSVSNHQPHNCLLKPLFRRRSKKTSKLVSLAYVRGIRRWPINSPHRGPLPRKNVSIWWRHHEQTQCWQYEVDFFQSALVCIRPLYVFANPMIFFKTSEQILMYRTALGMKSFLGRQRGSSTIEEWHILSIFLNWKVSVLLADASYYETIYVISRVSYW